MNTFITSLRTHWIRTIIISVIILGIGYFLWRRSHPNTSAPTYQTGTVERGTLVVSVAGSGTVSTANNVQVVTQASGVVKKIYVKNGDAVKVGQKIADLELDQEGQQRYSSALSSYQSAKNAVDGARASLYSQQSTMFTANQKFINGAVQENLAPGTPTYIEQNADWLASEANYKRQENVITQSQNALNAAAISYQQASATIYAPLSGTLTGFSLQLGSVITAQTTTTGSSSTQKIASVTTEAVPTISINLTQIDVPKIKVGNKATVTLDAYPDKSFTGKVVSIDTVGTTSSGVTAYPTVIALDAKSTDILPNMSAAANSITNTKSDVLIVPSTSVKTQNGVSTVQTMKDGKPTDVSVEIGLSSDLETEILSGVNEGDTVVTATIQGSLGTQTTGTTSVFSPFGRGVGGAARTTGR